MTDSTIFDVKLGSNLMDRFLKEHYPHLLPNTPAPIVSEEESRKGVEFMKRPYPIVSKGDIDRITKHLYEMRDELATYGITLMPTVIKCSKDAK